MLFIEWLSSDKYGFPSPISMLVFYNRKLVTLLFDLLLSWANMIYHSQFCSAVPRSVPSPLHTSLLLTQSACPLADLYFIVSIIILEPNFYAHLHLRPRPHPHPHTRLLLPHLRHMCKWWSNLSFQLAAPTPTPTPSPTRTRTWTRRRPRVVALHSRPRRPRRPRCCQWQCRCLSRVAVQFSIFLLLLLYSLSVSLSFSLCLFCTPLSFNWGGSSSTTPLRVASLKTKCRIMNRHVLHVREVL